MGSRNRERRAEAVQSTNDSSALSKSSLAARGYVHDAFAALLVPGTARRAPLIHRGYYVRARAVRHCVRAFVEQTCAAPGTPRSQILSLGAGSDSLYFRLKTAGRLAGAAVWEVDFPDVAERKAQRIRDTPDLCALTGPFQSGDPGSTLCFESSDYRILGLDLRQLQQLDQALAAAGLDGAAPTLLLAEAVLTYLEPDDAAALISWAAQRFSNAIFVVYEQMRPQDAFGEFMQQHFRHLNSPLHGLDRFPDAEAQQQRFLQAGWTACRAMDLNEFYRCFLPAEERRRMENLEPFDEFEEWHLKCAHYFILAASRGDSLSQTLVFPPSETFPRIDPASPSGVFPASVVTGDTQGLGLKRYGHASVLLSPGVILSAGGFGEQEGRHCRVSKFHMLLRYSDFEWKGNQIGSWGTEAQWDGRLYHTMTRLSDTQVLVLGGRLSPVTPALGILQLSYENEDNSAEDPNVTVTKFCPEDSTLSRWRHSTTEVSCENQKYLFVYGGRSVTEPVLSDWHFLHVGKMTWVTIPVEGEGPEVAALELRSVDLQSAKNNQEHHTQEMGLQRLIVRRSQSFTIQLHFNRPFHSKNDSITFVAETGPAPKELLGTRATFLLTQARQGNGWSASDFTVHANSLYVSLFTPPSAVIGPYSLKMEISQGPSHSTTHPLGTFILLFNPWSAEDDVYLPSETLLQEYIMMDYGFVYKGHERFITPWPWNYGQNPSKDYSQRNDVVYICRVVSAMINSNDDSGVLQGNWGEDYSRGVSPLEWTGSVAILRQWAARGGQPVKYGQCWVFAAVMCTVMRCLGVPTRVVSNFRSAHNSDANLTIDTYYDQHAEMLPTQKRDKIWNFHVWNECWMIRKDLPPGYNGWQVLDPTPQQTSSGLFRCGPASVKAIREGEIHLPYDTPFVYAEVNADEVVWLLKDGQAQEILAHNTSSIGKEISTKMVGSDQRENITSSYKYPEGSPEERSVFMKASQKTLGVRRTSSPFLDLLGSGGAVGQPAQLQLHLTRKPEWGQDLLLKLHARRVADRAHPQGPIHLVVDFCAQTLLHNGGTRKPLWRQKVHLTLDFGEDIQWPLSLPYNNYRNKLTDEKLIRVSGIAKVEETGRSMLVLKDISLEPPHLSIEVSERAEVGKALRVHISLTNTLSVPLSHCTMVLEGSGLVSGQISNDLGTLVAGHTIKIQVDLYPIKAGPRQLQVLVSSNEIKEIKGYKDIFVAAARAP
ncbi:hypothetical protein MJG53_012894 [Ovis ammon polii x Ovis aries]|uniref:tRNA wybutosine-synthesizing protein 4 n=2 Tax=Ovis TaxID=9935 RepID=A0A835ZX17_SHEEP|nr:hypothetical protein JEQ12_007963 [Ovis aries]KAI4573056.1 hypothetical protein MJG53_012894 [Ovis ammon polii x Ovis aries]